MLIQLVSFQPPLPSYVSCSRANCPDEKFKILMTRLLITPLLTTGFSRTTGTWREAKGSRFMMEQKQQAAGDPLTLTQGSRDQAAGMGKADEPSSCPDPQPLCSLFIRFTYQGVEHKLRNPISDIWQVLGEKKEESSRCITKNSASCSFVCFCFFLFGMPVHSEIILHAVGFLQQISAAAS